LVVAPLHLLVVRGSLLRMNLFFPLCAQGVGPYPSSCLLRAPPQRLPWFYYTVRSPRGTTSPGFPSYATSFVLIGRPPTPSPFFPNSTTSKNSFSSSQHPATPEGAGCGSSGRSVSGSILLFLLIQGMVPPTKRSIPFVTPESG